MLRSVSTRLPRRRAFLVQLGADTDPSLGKLTGRIEHVDTGRSAHFESREELHVFVRRVLGEEEGGEGGPPETGP